MFAAGGLAIALSLAAVVVAIVLLAGGGDSGDASTDGLKKAVIVDQLELTAPNPTFVSNARETLSQAGYSVDYIHGKDVTVDFYRKLPSREYDLVLLRVHAGITREVQEGSGETTATEYVSLFTGEPYDESKYGDELLNYIGRATYTDEPDGDAVYGIGPRFVADKMEGDFGGALVVLMGCDGLRSQVTAEAFTNRGASAFVSWSQQVSAPHTDEATEKLLQRLLIEGVPLREAVQQTAAEVGPDQAFGGELRVFPPS
jgi:hypothetical protein